LKNLALRLLHRRLPANLIMEKCARGLPVSRADALLLGHQTNGYATGVLSICPTQLGVPMQRPRLFSLGTTTGGIAEFLGRTCPNESIYRISSIKTMPTTTSTSLLGLREFQETILPDSLEWSIVRKKILKRGP